MKPTRPTPSQLRALATRDPVLGRAMKEAPPFPAFPQGRHSHFHSISRAIVSQQLAGKAANTIYGRVKALVPGPAFPTPTQFLELSDEELRGAGLSKAKTRAIRDLAGRVERPDVPHLPPWAPGRDARRRPGCPGRTPYPGRAGSAAETGVDRGAVRALASPQVRGELGTLADSRQPATPIGTGPRRSIPTTFPGANTEFNPTFDEDYTCQPLGQCSSPRRHSQELTGATTLIATAGRSTREGPFREDFPEGAFSWEPSAPPTDSHTRTARELSLSSPHPTVV